MTQCIENFKKFDTLKKVKSSPILKTKSNSKRRKEMLNQIIKINLLLLVILLLNGISNSYQQKKSLNPTEAALQAFAKNPITSKMIKKNF
ncbi:MAG: hypothetical protein CME70_16595 [Halobacteriovorax sp.]|nr:hypothetical protein [Halobacteriovorax sp.]|tara:strand:- start:63929 stop:64198 length:270 start_codon:yes stop_codon:yes gene_type:complete